MSENQNIVHYIKFITELDEIEYYFPIPPLYGFRGAGLDHHIQLKIVEYMKQNNIRGVEKRYWYYDEDMNEIMRNDKPLDHGAFVESKKS